eukprot:4800227-Prymnesium_polylepis.2
MASCATKSSKRCPELPHLSCVPSCGRLCDHLPRPSVRRLPRSIVRRLPRPSVRRLPRPSVRRRPARTASARKPRRAARCARADADARARSGSLSRSGRCARTCCASARRFVCRGARTPSSAARTRSSSTTRRTSLTCTSTRWVRALARLPRAGAFARKRVRRIDCRVCRKLDCCGSRVCGGHRACPARSPLGLPPRAVAVARSTSPRHGAV